MHHPAQNPRSATPTVRIYCKYCDRGSRFQPLRSPRDLLARPGGEPLRGLARILHGQSQSPVSSRGEAPRDKQYCKGRKLRGSD